MDSISAVLTTFGLIALACSWVALLATSSREDFTWALCTVLLPPLSYLYALFRLDVALAPVVLAFGGCSLVFLGIS